MTRYDDLVSKLLSIYEQTRGDEQYWLGLVGAPGSGKSTVADELRKRLTGKLTVIPMDGYHFPRKKLDSMENPVEAHARRGAPFTFDSARLVDELRDARKSGFGQFPSFDHVVGDPIENDIELLPGKQIVVVEGNYLLLDRRPWSLLPTEVFDEMWFLDVPTDECFRRVEARHVRTGLTREEAQHRVATNDGPNAALVRESKNRADWQFVLTG
ncbi:MAG: AAA family ATPase [Planctomycetota bacterium]